MCVLIARLYSKIIMVNAGVEMTGMSEGYMYMRLDGISQLLLLLCINVAK